LAFIDHIKTPISDDYTVAEARAARFVWPAGWTSVLGVTLAGFFLIEVASLWIRSLMVIAAVSFPLQLLLLALRRIRPAIVLYAVTFLVIATVGIWSTGGAAGPFAGALLFPLIGIAIAGSTRALKSAIATGALIILSSALVTPDLPGFPMAVSVMMAALIFIAGGVLLALALGWYRAEVARGEEQREELLKQMQHEEILQATSALVLRHADLHVLIREIGDLLASGLSASAVVVRLPTVSPGLLVIGPAAGRIDPDAKDVLAAMEQPTSDHQQRAITGPVTSLAFVHRGFAEASSVIVRGGQGDHGMIVLLFDDRGTVDLSTRGVLSGVGRLLGLALSRASAEREQTELEAQLRHSQKLEALGRLSAGVAHDFNNLMTVVMTGASLAVEEVEDEETRGDLLDILQAAESASALTRQLLAFSRQQATAPELVSINERLSDVGRMLHRILGDDVQLEMKLGTELKNVLIDPVLFEQVIINLAVNARDAMPHGGRFTLSTRKVLVDDDLASSLQLVPADHILIEASDTGEGMSTDVIDRVFEPFFTTKTRGEGTGLGLATAHGIVRQFGGALRVESAPGNGACFSILLPLAREDITMSSALRLLGSPAAQTTPVRVVLIDDDVLLRTVLARALRRRGYDVLEARDAAAALEALDSAPWDALITDVKMPGTGGVELAAEVRRRLPALPILFISGDEQVETTQGQMFLSKPFTPEVLDAALRELAAA
jgi:signal transduction histidine kinase